MRWFLVIPKITIERRKKWNERDYVEWPNCQMNWTKRQFTAFYAFYQMTYKWRHLSSVSGGRSQNCLLKAKYRVKYGVKYAEAKYGLKSGYK